MAALLTFVAYVQFTNSVCLRPRPRPQQNARLRPRASANAQKACVRVRVRVCTSVIHTMYTAQ